MIFTRVKVKNLYCFEETELDLTYPRRITDSVIEHEYLDERASNFRFKRLCIISGANASGKSSFGKVMLDIINIISRGREWAEKHSYHLTVEDQPGEIEVEFVYPTASQLKFRTLFLQIHSGIFKFRYAECPISKYDSVERCREKIAGILENKRAHGSSIYLDNLDGDSYHSKWDALEKQLSEEPLSKSWAFIISNINNSSDVHYIDKENKNYKSILLKILKTFDPSIERIADIFEEDSEGNRYITGYRIYFSNGKHCAMNEEGELDREYAHLFSQGTYQGIAVAGFTHNLIREMSHPKVSGTFFLDEKMSNSHTEIEREIVNLLAQKTNRYSQFFYTIHNYDILEMGFPMHSFVFIKRERGGNPQFIWADQACNKNDRNILSYVKNNFFNTIPDVSLLDEILWAE